MGYSFFRDSQSNGNFGAYSSGSNTSAKDENKCTDIDEFIVEDIVSCEYFTETKALPAEGSEVYIKKLKKYSRIVVVDLKSNMIIGHVPVTLNYIIECINKGYNYNGKIKLSTPDPLPRITVKINETK